MPAESSGPREQGGFTVGPDSYKYNHLSVLPHGDQDANILVIEAIIMSKVGESC